MNSLHDKAPGAGFLRGGPSGISVNKKQLKFWIFVGRVAERQNLRHVFFVGMKDERRKNKSIIFQKGTAKKAQAIAWIL